MDKEVKKLVIARLKTMPSNLRISIGNSVYSKEELIEKVEKEDEIGKLIVKVQLNYLKSFKNFSEYTPQNEQSL